MGLKKPFICEIAPKTYAINEFGLSTIYLLIGEKEALVIDTGCGVCDLPGIIKGLTDKPYKVVLTHGHFDHCGGMGHFQQVYLNEKDFGIAKGLSRRDVQEYADAFGKAGGYGVYDYSPDDVMDTVRLPEFLAVKDGDSFELGNRPVKVYEIPGHTPGGISLLDVKNRIIFSGDCCNTNLLAQGSSVKQTLKAMEKFYSLSPEFDQNFNGHVGFMGFPNCFSQPESVPQDLIHICRMILEGKGEPQPYDFLGHSFTKMRYGKAQMSYDPRHLTDEKNIQ